MAEGADQVKPRILVAALGNTLRGDDGVGALLLSLLESRYEFPPDVVLKDLGSPGLDLVLEMEGIEGLLVIDAALLDEPAGTVRVYREDEILAMPAPRRFDAHQPTIQEALLLAEHLGGRPKWVSAIAVAAEQFEFGAAVSNELVVRAGEAVEMVARELERMGVAVRGR